MLKSIVTKGISLSTMQTPGALLFAVLDALNPHFLASLTM